MKDFSYKEVEVNINGKIKRKCYINDNIVNCKNKKLLTNKKRFQSSFNKNTNMIEDFFQNFLPRIKKTKHRQHKGNMAKTKKAKKTKKKIYSVKMR